MSDAAAPCRRRTRARSTAGSSISSASAPPSRGRTRRSIVSEAPDLPPPPPPKRKRGRPSKKDLALRAQMAQEAQTRDVEVKQEPAEVAVEVKQESIEMKQASLEVKQERLDVNQVFATERLEVKREMLEVKQESADFVQSTSSSSKSRSLGSIRVDAELGVLQAYKNNHADIKSERTVKTEVLEEFREADRTVWGATKNPLSASAMGTSFIPAEQLAQAQPTKTEGKTKGRSKAKNLDVAGQPSSSQIMEKRPARCVHCPISNDGNARLTISNRARDKWVALSLTRSPAVPLTSQSAAEHLATRFVSHGEASGAPLIHSHSSRAGP
jgi:hypothetical protein